MFRSFRFLAPAAVIAAFSGFPIVAQPAVGNVTIKFSGEGKWRAECSFSKAGGDSQSMKRNGRGRESIKSMSVRRVTAGSCDMQLPEGTSMKVTFTGGRTIACPFGDLNPCTRVFRAGEGTSFRF